MCFGGFMALLDIQVVASSLQDIGGGLSAAQDQIAWVQTAYLIAEIIVIPLSGWLTRVFSTRWLFAGSAVGFTRHQPVVRDRLEHREHDRVPGTAGAARRLDDPDRLHLVLSLFRRAAPGLRGGGGRHDRLDRADPWAGDRRLDHRHARLALAVLRQSGAGRDRRGDRADPGQDRPARSFAAEGRGLPRHRAAGPDIGQSGICAGRRLALELVRRCDDHRLRLDRRHLRRAVCRAQLDLCASGRRFARARQSQFLARLLSVVRHRHRYLFDDLSDAAVSRLCARVQRVADRHRDLLDRRRVIGRRAGLCDACPQDRHALADDVRAREFRGGDVVVQLYHP